MPPARITPGQSLSPQQKTGLEIVAHLHGGRDVVLAIDVTESVGLNDKGRIHLRQIVEDSLKPGDSVYVVPFASDVVPLAGASDVYPLGTPIEFSSKSQDNINKILQKIPFAPDLKLQNTDIERAELTVYQGLAQINQNRLGQHQPIKPQSVVWITDAPLFTKQGNEWIETPVSSPFRVGDSPESRDRQAWLDALPMNKRSLAINNYNLSVVDIAPTVQEFCTPAPGGQKVCQVNSYIFGQLWLPVLILGCGVLALVGGVWYGFKLRKKWRITVTFEGKEDERECRPLSPGKCIAIGAGEADSRCVDVIDCPGTEIRAYLERNGNQLYLKPTKLAGVELTDGTEINKQTRITGNSLNLNCPDESNRAYCIDIKIGK